MSFSRESITLTTDGDGDAVGVFTGNRIGFVQSITYDKDDFADGVDFTIVVTGTGETLWTDTNINATETVYPVAQRNGTDGAALANIYDRIALINDSVTVTVASGGATTSGTFTLTLTT